MVDIHATVLLRAIDMRAITATFFLPVKDRYPPDPAQTPASFMRHTA